MTDRQLIEIAREAMENSYSPYSGFPVGAALECQDGAVFTGCNVENAAFGAAICAESAAVVSAVSAGNKRFKRIAVCSNGVNYCMPCGTCLQRLLEFAPRMEVLCVREDGRYVSYPLQALVPHPFSADQMERP